MELLARARLCRHHHVSFSNMSYRPRQRTTVTGQDRRDGRIEARPSARRQRRGRRSAGPGDARRDEEACRVLAMLLSSSSLSHLNFGERKSPLQRCPRTAQQATRQVSAGTSRRACRSASGAVLIPLNTIDPAFSPACPPHATTCTTLSHSFSSPHYYVDVLF